METEFVRKNYHIIHASRIPPCKFVKTIPIPDCDMDNYIYGYGMLSVESAKAIASKSREIAIKKPANNLFKAMSIQMINDIKENPKQREFNYEFSLVGINDEDTLNEITNYIREEIIRKGWKNVEVQTIEYVIPTICIKFTM